MGYEPRNKLVNKLALLGLSPHENRRNDTPLRRLTGWNAPRAADSTMDQIALSAREGTCHHWRH